MRWSAGWYGTAGPPWQPAGGRAVPGWETTWTCAWPPGRVQTTGGGTAAVAVAGECGADPAQLHGALPRVQAGDWRALTRWPGSYLTLARFGSTVAVIGDLAGQHPVYYRTDTRGVWWATSAAALAALDRAPVDTVALAARLAFGQHDVLAQQALFRGVRRVPPGHLLLLTPAGAQVQRYEPAAYTPFELEQAAPTVRAALSEAVATRIEDGRPISADLAGLDSTTLACLAAQQTPVTAVTFADPRLRDDDLHYAQRTAACVAGLRHHTVPGSAQTVYYAGLDAVERLPVTDAPNAYTVTHTIKRAVLDTVTEHAPARYGVHLTGAAGDALLSAPSAYLADLLRERKYRRAVSHATAHARLRGTNARTVLTRARPASRTTLAGDWRQVAAELRAAPRSWVPQVQRPVAWSPLLATADWMSRQTRGQLAEAVASAAETVDQPPARLAQWSDRQDVVQVGADVSGWRELALAEYGLEVSAPFLDNEVIRACLAVPADQRGAPGRYKPLLTHAFTGSGVVPEFVLSRPTKGGFNAVMYQGLRAHRAVVQELLGPASRLAANGLVTTQPVTEMLNRAAAGQATAAGALHLAVAAEVWLRQIETAPAFWEVTSRVAAT